MLTPSSRAAVLATAAAAMSGGLVAQNSPVLDNAQVRVLVVTDQPHAKGRPHEHKLNRVMIYLQPGRQEITPEGGRKTVLEWKAGEVKWSPAAGTHVSEIVSDAPVKMVEVEVKGTGGPAAAASSPLDPVKVDPQHYRVEFENSQVRVTRVKLPPHARTPMHEHMLNRVVVYLAEQNSKMTTPDGKSDVARHKAGEVSWAGPAKHQEENLGDATFEAVVVEPKN